MNENWFTKIALFHAFHVHFCIVLMITLHLTHVSTFSKGLKSNYRGAQQRNKRAQKKFCDFDLKSPNREKMLQLREKIAKSTEIIERDIFFRSRYSSRKKKEKMMTSVENGGI